MKRYIAGAAIACALLLTGSTAQADPLLVTGGSFRDGVSTGFWTLIGDGFSLSGASEGSAGGLFNSCRPCGWEPAPVSLNFSVDVFGGPFLGGRPGTFNGVSYPTTVFDGQLHFTGPSLSAAVLSPTNLLFTLPFTMTGHLTAFANGSDEFLNNSPLFAADFMGRGTVTARFNQDPTEPGQPNLFDVASVVYRFESSESPVPEPATLLMLGAGLVIVAHRMRRRRV
jgi:PEP-CTERM motif